MNARNLAVGLASFVASSSGMLPLLGCIRSASGDDDIVDVGELRSLAVEIDRDGSGDHYPRTLGVHVLLPWPHDDCPVLDAAMTFMLNGQPPLYEVYRGGLSPQPGIFGNVVCEALAGTSFRVPDEGGPLVVRIEQPGFEPAVIELAAPAIEPLELVAPADGHLRPGAYAQVRVPASFYTSRKLTPATAQPFAKTLLVARGQDLADYRSDKVIGAVAGAENVFAEIPSYTKPGAKSLYVAYTYSANFEPMAIGRCDGFADCVGQARDNFGVLGPVDVIVE